MTTPTATITSPSPTSPPTSTESASAPTAGGRDGLVGGEIVGGEILVCLREPADLTGSLRQGAVRARAGRRPLTVVVVEPPRMWTIDAAVIAVQDRRRSREVDSMTRAAHMVCDRIGVPIQEVIVLRPSWAWTRRSRNRAVDTQLTAIAESRGAELHPAPPPRVSVTTAEVMSAGGVR